jgi:broad specificity phosphatase PhoE
LRRFHFDALFASPMKRVRQTFAPLAARTGMSPVIMDDLREVHFGDWQGLTWEQVHARYGVSAFEWLDQLESAAVPNGESAEQFRARVQPCLRQILAECEGRSVAVFCHGGVIRMMLAILLELPLPVTAGFEVDYASVTRVEYRPRRTEIQLLNLAPWRDVP